MKSILNEKYIDLLEMRPKSITAIIGIFEAWQEY
jgi:hypothetical protein